LFIDSLLNNEHPNNNTNDIPNQTDNEEIEPTNRSPSNSPEEHENSYQRQTIIPTVHIDSVINHNHNEEEEEEEDQLNNKNSDNINEQSLSSPSIKDTNDQRKIIL
jgi:hypothetical protein